MNCSMALRFLKCFFFLFSFKFMNVSPLRNTENNHNVCCGNLQSSPTPLFAFLGRGLAFGDLLTLDDFGSKTNSL